MDIADDTPLFRQEPREILLEKKEALYSPIGSSSTLNIYKYRERGGAESCFSIDNTTL